MANNSCVTQEDLLSFYNTYVKPYINAESGGHEIKNDGDVTTLEQRELMTFKSPIFAADNSSTQSTDIDVDTDADLSSFPIPVTSKQEWEHNYSTSEQVVGTWIDGKPLYEKVIDNITFTTNQVEVSIDSTNIILFINGGVIDAQGNNLIPLGYGVSEPSQVNAYVNTSTNQILIQNAYYASRAKAYLVIQYTKTTDTAIS